MFQQMLQVLLSNSLVHGQAIQQDGGVKKQGIVAWRRVKLSCGQSYSPFGCFNALTCVEDDRRRVSLVVLCNDPARVMTLGRSDYVGAVAVDWLKTIMGGGLEAEKPYTAEE